MNFSRHFAAAVFTFTFSSAALAAPATGPLRVLASNPRYFTDGSGKAIYLTGSHTWTNFATDQGSGDPPVAFDYAGFLDFLVAHHHNFFRGWTWDVPYSKQGNNGGPFHYAPAPWLRTGPGLATDGKPKFDLTKWNQTYFDRVRTRTIAARDRGIYVSIMLFQTYAWQFGRTDRDGFPLDGRNNINGIDAGPAHAASTLAVPAVTARQEEYVRRIVDAVNDLDNVLYEIGNEATGDSTAWQYHMIDLIHAYEKTKPKQHPVGMTFQYKGGTHEELFASPADWISPDCGKGYIKDPLAADGRKVMIVDTDHGYGWPALKRDGPAAQLAWVWKNLCRGNQTLFMDPYLAKIGGANGGRNNPIGTNPADSYFGLTPDPYWETLRVAMGRARRYADKIDLAGLLPRGDLCSTTYCLAKPRSEYLAYHPGGGTTLTVMLARGTYDFEWYDPTADVVAAPGRFSADEGERAFTVPFVGDGVLHIRRAR